MKMQPINSGFMMASLASLLMVPLGVPSVQAETFSFNLKDLGITESADGSKTFGGQMTLEGEAMEDKTFEFDLTHGDRGDGQSLEMGLRNQGESVLEAVFDFFGLNSRKESGKLNAKVSGDINETESDIDIELGENLPGARMKIKTPQGNQFD